MRHILLLISALFVVYSCVKPPSTSPIPLLTFKDVSPLQKVSSASAGPRDTAVLIFRYSDGDGDLFRDSNSDGPNLIYTTYAFNADSNRFIMNGFPNSAILTQPPYTQYKGKAIQGDVYVPMRQFRSGDDIKILKFEVFMVDMKNNKSNVITSPVYTLNF